MLPERFQRWLGRHVVSINVVLLIICAFSVAISMFAWLRHALPFTVDEGIDVFTSLLLAGNLYANRSVFHKILPHKGFHYTAVLSALPLMSIVGLLAGENDRDLALMLMHGLYLPNIYYFIKHYATEHVVPLWAKVTIVLISLFLGLHCLASLWMILSPRAGVDFATEYNLALYFITTTVATVGYGDITPSDNLSRLYTMGLELLGVCLFGIVIGRVSSMVMNADRHKEHMKDQLESLSSLFKRYDIPLDVQRKSYKFFQHVLSKTSNEDEQKLLAMLPHGMQAELRIYMNIKPISKVSLFKHCRMECLIDVAKELEQKYFNPGQHIIRMGDIGDAMYIMGLGKVKVHDGDHLIAELHDGQCFGEMSLIEREPRRADVTALSHCDVFILSKERFDYLVSTHHDLQLNVRNLIESRRRKPAS